MANTLIFMFSAIGHEYLISLAIGRIGILVFIGFFF